MDYILLAAEQGISDDQMKWLVDHLLSCGLIVVPEKVQHSAPWKYLGWLISDAQIQPQKVTLTTQITNLHDAQRLLGDLQWVCTHS